MASRQYSPAGRSQGRFVVTASRMMGDPEIWIEIRDLGGTNHRYTLRTEDSVLGTNQKLVREVDGATITLTKGEAITGDNLGVKIDIGDGFDHETAIAIP